MLRNIFTGGESLDQFPVEFSPGCIVDVGNERLRLIETGIAYETFEAVGLSVTVFDIDQHPETILKSDILHLRVIHLCEKCIRHGCQAHFDQFINSALVRHGQLPPVVVTTSGDGMRVTGFSRFRFRINLFWFVLSGDKNVFHRLVAGARSV